MSTIHSLDILFSFTVDVAEPLVNDSIVGETQILDVRHVSTPASYEIGVWVRAMRIGPLYAPVSVTCDRARVCVAERGGRVSVFDECTGALVSTNRTLEQRIDLLYRVAPPPIVERRGLLAAALDPECDGVFYALYATLDNVGELVVSVARVEGERVRTMLACRRSSVCGGALAFGDYELGHRLLYVAVGEEEGARNGFVTCLDASRERARKFVGHTSTLMTRDLATVVALDVADVVRVGERARHDTLASDDTLASEEEPKIAWRALPIAARQWPVDAEPCEAPRVRWRVRTNDTLASVGTVERV